MADIKSIIEQLVNLPPNRLQYILNWLSARYIAVIMRKCNDNQKTKLYNNMSKGLKERVDDELNTNSRELDKSEIVKTVFKTLYDAISSDSYNKEMIDKSYKRRRQ
jgi:flagellar motor switch protein FliG